MPPQGQPQSSLTGPPGSDESLFPAAWQPLTPSGVAAFAFSSGRRLLIVQSIVAILSVSVLLAVLHHAAVPLVQKAVQQLPDEGVIVHRNLVTPLTNVTLLAESRVLAVVADAPGYGMTGLRSDFRIWFRQREVAVCSVFGCMAVRYPRNWEVSFNRREVQPAMEAWIPFVDAGIALVHLASLFLAWTFLATVFCPIPLLVARYSDRALSWRGSWRLAGAALMPGALLATAGLAAYGYGLISLVQLLIVAVLHLMLGWLYLVLAPLSLPRREAVEQALNPFSTPDAPLPPPEDSPRNHNPFASS